MNDQSNDVLFATPPSRPMPDSLRQRVLTELQEEPEAKRHPAVPWVAALVAASIPIAAIVGVLSIQHRPEPPTMPPAPTAHALTGQELITACREHIAATGSASDKTLTTPLLSADGSGVLFHNQSGAYGVCAVLVGEHGVRAESFQSVSATPVVPVLTPTPTKLQGANLAITAGRRPANEPDGSPSIDGNDSTTAGSYWIFSRQFSDADLAAQPTSKLVSFDTQNAAFPSRYIAWPGTNSDVPLRGAAGKDACLQAVKAPDTNATIVDGPNQRGILIAYGQQAFLCVPLTNGTVTKELSASPDAPVLTYGFSVGDPSTTQLIGGRLPTGVNKVQLQFSTGTVNATVANGFWIYDTLLDHRSLGLQPMNVLIEMTGGAAHQTIYQPWVDATRDPAYLASTFPTMRGGDALRAACTAKSPGSKELVLTYPAHVELLQPGQDKGSYGLATPQLCTCQGATTALVNTGSHDPKGAVISPVSPIGSGPAVLMAAAGPIRPGTTSMVFHTPTGDVDANINNGYWAVEWLVPNATAKALPKSLTVSVENASGTTEIQMPVSAK